MGVVETLRCLACGHDRRPSAYGLRDNGEFDPHIAQPNELELRHTRFAGRGRITHEVSAIPVHFALGLRAMLKFRLAQVEADIRAAGVELLED